ncbi:MAG TPA: PLP-dependent aminotransferase family protein [Trebonia sp.]|nr:PLP-dependent aminotransferase family protein [Trebonia sp.]
MASWLRDEVRHLAPGDRLPSTRSLVEAHKVSPVTVSRALAVLAGEGLVVTRPGAGAFVAERTDRDAAADMSWQAVVLGERSVNAEGISSLADPPGADDVISLASGYPHASLMPMRALGSALNYAARAPRAWERPPTAGLASLRTWFARHSGAGTCEARDVIITPGGQAAITAALRALLRPGEPLLTESPTYPGVLAAARLAGLRALPVPVDEHGVIPGLLAEAFARSGARAFYCQPTYHNPTGAVLTAGRRAEVLAVAAAAQAFIVEDDASRWLSHHQRPPRSLLADDRDGRVVYLTSLTKAASPSLRVGALIARGPVAGRLQAIRVVDDLFVARPLQEAALNLVTRPAWEEHLRALGDQLGQRSSVLARELSSALPAARFLPPAGGMHLWARLPAGSDDVEIASAARRAGVVVLPGQPFFPAEPSGPHLRLTFSAASSAADLRSGVRRLSAAVAMAQASEQAG